MANIILQAVYLLAGTGLRKTGTIKMAPEYGIGGGT